MRFSSDAPRTWMGLKEQGKQHFERGDYEQALASYRAALSPEFHIPNQEKQLILSNTVACRLKIGGQAQARAAVQDAQHCVRLNPAWAKAHVRLASAYIALGNHSNEACNSLQTALRLDSGNPVARQMLVRELRRDSASRHPSSGSIGLEENDMPPNASNRGEIDESLTWRERTKMFWTRLQLWYQSRSDVQKSLLQVAVVLVVLYVAFGGRFGFEYLQTESSHRTSRSRRTTYDSRSRESYSSRSFESPSWSPERRRGSNSGYFDGSLSYMVLVAAAVYVSKLLGINPFVAVAAARMLGGRRGGGPVMYGGGGYYQAHRRRW